MKKVRELISTIVTLLPMVKTLNDQEKATADEIAHMVNHGDFEDDKHLRKLSDLQLRITLIPAQRRKLERQIVEAYRALVPALKTAARQWDLRIKAAKEAVFEELITAVLPFYGGEEKWYQTRKEFSAQHVPARDRFNKCWSFLQDHEGEGVSGEQVFWAAQSFIDRVERLCEELGWKVPE